MDLQLAGRTALVTGSSAGLGVAIAQRLLDEGVLVAVHGRDASRTEAVAERLRAGGGTVVAVLGDLSEDEGAARVAAGARAALGTVDVLVNNAGVFVNRGWEEATPTDWAAVYSADVLSAVRLVRALVPSMRERGWGRVVNIATSEASDPFPHMPDYSAAKAALLQSSVSLARHLAGSGVTVNTVSPGILATDAVRAWYEQVGRERGWGADWADVEAGVLREVLPNTVGRLGDVEGVAALVAFLASPLAWYCTASNYRIDGGSTATVN